jgi:hypothetical protein
MVIDNNRELMKGSGQIIEIHGSASPLLVSILFIYFFPSFGVDTPI